MSYLGPKDHLIPEQISEDSHFPKLQRVARISALLYKNLQGRNPSNISLQFWKCLHKFVLRLSDLYIGTIPIIVRHQFSWVCGVREILFLGVIRFSEEIDINDGPIFVPL